MATVDPVQLAIGARRDADLAQIMADLAGPNPHPADMNLPPALTQDGGRPS